MVALLALRLGVGWHFFKEGIKKFEGDSFTSAYFLENSKGPLSEFYRSMIPDRQGHNRLDFSSTAAYWDQFADRVGDHYNLDAEQTKAAESVVEQYKNRLKWYLNDKGDDLKEYFLECERLAAAKSDKTRSIPFQTERIEKLETELRGKAAPWLADIRTFEKQLEKDLNEIGVRSQGSRGHLALADRSSMWVDEAVKYTVLGVGVLLILGLFTRFASLVGIMFLLSVISTQPFWVAGVEPTYYQVVEVLALFVLFAFAAGRFGGLDFLLHALRLRCCPPKQTGF